MIIAAMLASVTMGLCSLNGSQLTPCAFTNSVQETNAAVAFKFVDAGGMTLMLGGPIIAENKFRVEAAQVNDTFVSASGECVVAAPRLSCRFTVGTENHSIVFIENRP